MSYLLIYMYSVLCLAPQVLSRTSTTPGTGMQDGQLCSINIHINSLFTPLFLSAYVFRLVHKEWKTSGAAVVNNNFARLTPDRQSKKGALWSKKSLGVDSFSAILKYVYQYVYICI